MLDANITNIGRYTARRNPNTRKAALRTNPDWLNALELPDARFTTIAPNAAELWGAALPDMRIMARRRELDAHAPTEEQIRTDFVNYFSRPRPLEAPDAAGRDWVWTLATVMLLVAIVAACARVAHFV